MDLTRKYLDLECSVCGEKYKQQKRVNKIAKWKDRCNKHRHQLIKKKSVSVKRKRCVDCGVPTYDTRCKKCSGKKRRTLNHNKRCVDCGKKIRPKSTRCQKCHNINQDKGKSKKRTKFNASKKWGLVRNKAFNRDNHTCQICNIRGSKELHGHHIKPYKDYPNERLNVDNVITLCSECHLKLHHNKEFRNKHRKLYVQD